VHVLDDARPREVAPGVELVGAPWLSRRPARNPALDALDALGPPGPLRILAAHGGVDVLTPDRRDASLLPLAPVETAIEAERIHYAALGDRHSKTRVGGTGRIWYAGAPEPTDFDEREPGFALVVELDRAGARVEAHHVGTWRFARPPAVDLSGPGDLDALADRLTDFDAKERTALRLELRGALDLHGAARLDALLDRARDLFAGIDARTSELRVAADAGEVVDLALSGFAARAVDRLTAEAGAETPDARIARDALALLVRLADAPESAR
jgi:DNA repair exonuclease SbcCD nuclease subunit